MGALALAAALVGLPLSLIWALYWTWEVLEEGLDFFNRPFDLNKSPWPLAKALLFACVGYVAAVFFWNLLCRPPTCDILVEPRRRAR